MSPGLGTYSAFSMTFSSSLLLTHLLLEASLSLLDGELVPALDFVCCLASSIHQAFGHQLATCGDQIFSLTPTIGLGWCL